MIRDGAYHIPSSGKADVYYFTVVGHGEFPLDMLRYDSAFPTSAEDTEKIVARYSDAVRGGGADPTHPPVGRYGGPDPMRKREVRLGCVQRGGPTLGRWASFGWVVKNPAMED